MMKALVLAAALAALASPAFAVPYCDNGVAQDGMKADFGFGPIGEEDSARMAEAALHGRGIDAHNTRFWNGCIQTWVTVDGQDQMRFFNPDSLAEIPAD